MIPLISILVGGTDTLEALFEALEQVAVCVL